MASAVKDAMRLSSRLTKISRFHNALQTWHLWKCRGKKFRVHTRKLLLWLTKCYSRFGPWSLDSAMKGSFSVLIKKKIGLFQSLALDVQTEVAFGGEAAGGDSHLRTCPLHVFARPESLSAMEQQPTLQRGGKCTKDAVCSLVHDCTRFIVELRRPAML